MTIAIILITSLISLAGFYNNTVSDALIFNPYLIKHKKEWWRFLTCGLLHADFIHLFINMFVLFSFGQATEHYYSYAFGSKATLMYLTLYISGIFAANVSTYYKFHHIPTYRSLGASGAVSAILFTTLVFNPYAKIYLYGIIGLPGIVIGLAYLVYSYYMSKKEGDHINHEAHFYGAIYGFIFPIAFKPALFLVFINQLVTL